MQGHGDTITQQVRGCRHAPIISFGSPPTGLHDQAVGGQRCKHGDRASSRMDRRLDAVCGRCIIAPLAWGDVIVSIGTRAFNCRCRERSSRSCASPCACCVRPPVLVSDVQTGPCALSRGSGAPQSRPGTHCRGGDAASTDIVDILPPGRVVITPGNISFVYI